MTRSTQPSPNFNPPRQESICATADLTAANEVEGFHRYNQARARVLIRSAATAMDAATEQEKNHDTRRIS